MINLKKDDAVADAIREILQQEALKGDQHEIDANKNNKIDPHDFKLLRAKKEVKKEEAEQVDEAKKESKEDFDARQKRLVAAGNETAKDPERLKKLSKIPGYNAAMNLAKKSTNEEVKDEYARKVDKYLKKKHAPDAPVKEEVEQLDELSKSTLGSYTKKASRDATITRKIGADFENNAKRSRSPGMKAAANSLSDKYKSKSWKRKAGIDKAVDRLTREDVEGVKLKTLSQFKESWSEMLADVKKRAEPQPSGGAGIKQGSRYGGSKQKPEDEKKK